jgi:N-acetylneuraminic acid mutarotase
LPEAFGAPFLKLTFNNIGATSAYMTRASLFGLPWVLIVMLGCAGAPPPAASAKAAPVEATPAPGGESPALAPPAPIEAQNVVVGGALLPPMPVAVTSFGAVADAAHLYTLGGYFGTPHEYSREGQSRAVQRLALDGASGWETIGELEQGLQGVALVMRGAELCRIGGLRASNAKGEDAQLSSLTEAACFDVAQRSWRKLPDLPAGRSSHDAVIAGSTIYVGGGWQLAGDASSGAWATDVLALDLAKPNASWTKIASPIERRALAMAAAGGRVIAIGGMTKDREMSRRVDVLDPSSGKWSQGPDFPADAFGLAATGSGATVFASARDGVLYRWTIGERAWTSAASLSFPRFFHRLIAGGSEAAPSLIAIGGISGMHTDGRTRMVERLALPQAAPRVSSITASYPGAAKNRQAIWVDGDFAYLFGGNNSLEQHDFEPKNFVAEGWRLHLPSLQWQRVADYPAARQSMAAAQWEGHALVMGGFGHDGTEAVSHGEAYAFDLEKQTFSARAGLPKDKGRTQFGLTQHGGKLWVFGGLNYDPRRAAASFDHVTSVLTAPADDAAAAFVESKIALPAPRRAFAGASVGDRYYMVGGMRGEFELVHDCVAFDFKTEQFTPFACPRATRLSAQLVPLGGKLYLVGGSTQQGKSLQAERSVEVFDPATGKWAVVLEELPFDMRHTRALAYGSQLLVISTHNDEGKLRLALVSPTPR